MRQRPTEVRGARGSGSVRLPRLCQVITASSPTTVPRCTPNCLARVTTLRPVRGLFAERPLPHPWGVFEVVSLVPPRCRSTGRRPPPRTLPRRGCPDSTRKPAARPVVACSRNGPLPPPGAVTIRWTRCSTWRVRQQLARGRGLCVLPHDRGRRACDPCRGGSGSRGHDAGAVHQRGALLPALSRAGVRAPSGGGRRRPQRSGVRCHVGGGRDRGSRMAAIGQPH